MPFTASHPAAVLLLVGTPLPASALVVGSMAPDLPYYLPGPTGPTHTAYGVVTLDLLLGLAAWLVWHGVLAAPALAAAPAGVRARLAHVGVGQRLGSPRLVLLVLLALVVGAATHVGWDEFTHAGRWGPRHVAVLRQEWAGTKGFQWLQYASTVVGALVIAAWLARWWRRTPPAAGCAAGSPWAWVLLAATGLVGGATAALGADSLRSAAYRGATTSGSAVLLVALALAAAWHGRDRSTLS